MEVLKVAKGNAYVALPNIIIGIEIEYDIIGESVLINRYIFLLFCILVGAPTITEIVFKHIENAIITTSTLYSSEANNIFEISFVNGTINISTTNDVINTKNKELETIDFL